MVPTFRVLLPARLALAALLAAGEARAQVTVRVSIDSAGLQANQFSQFPELSADGRYVVFGSYATNLVAGDTNGVADVFVRDRVAGTTERVSVSSAGVQGNVNSLDSTSISPDGRFVAFGSIASTLVAGDTNGGYDVFLRDRQLGTTERVSVQTGGAQALGGSLAGWTSADGRHVAFRSSADNLVAGDTNFSEDVFVRDRVLGVTERVNVGPGGLQANGSTFERPTISADGRFVAFASSASNLVPNDTNGRADIFVRDRGPAPILVLCSGDGAAAFPRDARTA